jgi:prophage regulatory protein
MLLGAFCFSRRKMPRRRIIRLPQLKRKVGFSRSQIYAMAAGDEFPRPIRLGGSCCVGWVEDEIDAWIERQIVVSREAEAARKPERKAEEKA